MVSNNVLHGIEKEWKETTHPTTKYGDSQPIGNDRRVLNDSDVGFVPDLLDIEGVAFGDDGW